MQGGLGDPPPAGMLTRLLCAATSSAARRPGSALAIVLLVSLLSVGITARFLTFKTSRADLIDPEADFQQRWLAYVERFGEHPDLVTVVESESPARVTAVMDELGEAMQAEPELFDRVYWKVDLRGLKRKGLQFLAPRELEQGFERLQEFGPVLDGHWNRAGLESYCRSLASHARWGLSNQNPAEAEASLLQAARLIQSLTRFAAGNPLTAHGHGNRPANIFQLADGRSVALDETARVEAAGEGAGLPGPRGGSLSSFESPWPLVLPWSAERFDSLAEVRYQVTEDGRMGFVLAMPLAGQTDFAGASPPIQRLRQLIAEVQQRNPDARLGLTGIPVLESDEMKRSQADMTRASFISFAGVAVLLLIGFRGFRHPALALVMLLVGLAWSLGYTTLVVGHLNILSVSFAAILIGLGIDFAIHYLARYLELRHENEPLESSLVKTTHGVGSGIATAAITTALAFFCATFTKFLGVAELGIIAGGGILLCAAASLVALPALVAVADRRVDPGRLPTPFEGRLLRRMTSRRPWTVGLGSLAVLLGVGACALTFEEGRIVSRVEYDSNLLNLQAEGMESVNVQERIFEKARGSLLYAVSLADGPAEARRRAEQLERSEHVSYVEHLAAMMPAYPAGETSLLVQAFHARLANLSALPREFPLIDPLAIGQALEELLAVLGESNLRECQEAALALNQFLNDFEAAPLARQLELLGSYQYAMLTALRVQFEQIAAAADPEPVGPEDLDPALRGRFVSSQGDWLLRVFPSEQVWDEAPLAAFVQDVREVDPEATGAPLQNYEASRQIRQSYFNAAIYAFLMISFVLLVDALESGPLCVAVLSPLVVLAFAIVTLEDPTRQADRIWLASLYVGVAFAVGAVFDFANVRNTVLAMLPPIAGLVLMFGVLGLLGYHLNPANLIVLPLVLGIGVDDGVHVMHDFRSQVGRYRMSASTFNAVLMTSLTSMVGFGSMLASSHRGLESLGLVLVIGVGTCLCVSLVTLPAILTLLTRRRGIALDPVGVLAEAPSLDVSEGDGPYDPWESGALIPLRPIESETSTPEVPPALRRATGS